jgi:hypothetical protein
MNDYIAKPVDERLLYSKIVGIVRKPSSKRSKEKIVAVNKVQKYIDLGYLDSRTKSNPKLMMEMIAAYLQQTPVSSCNGRKHGKQRLGITSAHK